MHTIPVNNPAAPTGLPLSRRSLLRGGTVLGLSAVATAGLASAPMATAALAAGSARTSPQPTPHANLVADYRPSQPTGWSPTSMPEPGAEEVVGMTVGGHTSSLSFPYRGVSYRLSLLSFGQPGDSADPVYEATPTDSTINFRQTLANKFGDYYSFNYVGGFKGQHEFSVQSYSVFVHEPTDTSPALNYGANLYFVYTPDLRRGDPDIHRSLQFVQVVNWVQANGSPTPASYVDCAGRANPFYSIGGADFGLWQPGFQLS
jgi:hypothetical protein